MIDIHNHALPFMDDGAADLEESAALLRLSVEDGVTHVILTPHSRYGEFENDKAAVEQVFKKYREWLQNAVPEITLLLGCEIRLWQDTAQRIIRGDYCTMADTRYVLTEFHFNELPLYAVEALETLVKAGLRPIVAHPERFSYFSLEDVDRWSASMIEMGAVIQITAGSLLGQYGIDAQRKSLRLLELDAVSFVASDGHNLEDRLPLLSSAYDLVKEGFGTQRAETLFTKNQEKLLRNVPLKE